ncbi:MAG: L,D-transpeptidase [Polyangiaceae bacterium]
MGWPSRTLALLLVGLVAPALGCGAVEDPPGRTIVPATTGAELALPETGSPASTGGPDAAEPALDTAHEPGHGARIASIAMRTWIYVGPDDRSTKLGYLRAGAVVDRAEEPAGTTNCAGGWYRILPRGFVCVGKGASLAIDHQVAAAAVRGPNRKGPIPYEYVFAGSPPPHLYFRLPSWKDQEYAEGKGVKAHAKLHASRLAAIPLDDVPDFLAQGRELPKPYGADEKLHFASGHAGRAKEASAFGLITSFDWNGRRFGLTTELDLLPLDRTKVAKASKFQGIVVPPPPPEGANPTDDKAFAPELAFVPAVVPRSGAAKLKRVGTSYVDDGVAPPRSGWVLTGHHNGHTGGLLETTSGAWIAADALAFQERHSDTQGQAEAGRKWIEVSIKKQLLVAWEGTRPVFATLVSTGRGGMSDPTTTTATVRGVFFIRAKHVSGTMDGTQGEDSYELHDVPFIQYFHEGYALHGAFWHDEFGKPRSHGCVNLSPPDAAWLFEWTDPFVPAEWHGAVNAEGGTMVWVHG